MDIKQRRFAHWIAFGNDLYIEQIASNRLTPLLWFTKTLRFRHYYHFSRLWRMECVGGCHRVLNNSREFRPTRSGLIMIAPFFFVIRLDRPCNEAYSIYNLIYSCGRQTLFSPIPFPVKSNFSHLSLLSLSLSPSALGNTNVHLDGSWARWTGKNMFDHR